jgi:hypothetical protein
MNNKVLIKCIEELKKSKPRIDYVLGMLEALSEGDVVVTPVRTEVSSGGQTVVTPTAPFTVTAPILSAVATKSDPAGEVETPEQRQKRLGVNKVPPAFLGDIRRMNLDPAKTDGKTDITPHS